ncbi:MAG: ubiquinol-cytochrome c reductase iron-sulfur subunit [Chloroflexota bacterium]
MAQNATEGMFFPRDEAGNLADAQKGSGPSRRLVLRWVGWGAILATLGQWSTGFLSFFWPKKVGAFGGVIAAGTASELAVGDVKVIREGKFYLSRVPEGFLALAWKCPHLGCTVPWKPEDQLAAGDEAFANKGRFNCPCHGSLYNRYGQIVFGPAPRPMDRFEVSIRDGRVFVNTGKLISRARASGDQAVSA